MNSNPATNLGLTRRFGAALLAAILFALSLNQASAALNAYESFNYATIGNGTLAPSGVASQTVSGGYTGAWTFGGGATAALDSASLAYPGLLTANKALVINSVGGSYIQDALATTLSTGTYYISYLFKPGTSVNGGNNGAGFVDNGVQIAPGGSGVYLGVQAYGATAGRFTVNRIVSGWNDNGPQLYQSAAADIVYGTTNLIVLKLVSTSANSWNGSVWVNPTAGTSSEPAASGTFTGITCSGAIQYLALLNRAGGNTLTFDEIRVGTTWADAVSYITTPPTAPTGLAVTATGNNSVSLSWTAPGGGDAPVSYYVKRSTTSGSGYVTVGTNAYPTATFTDAVVGGQTYYYVVSAVNAGGESLNSSEVSAAPTLAAPAAPASLTANASDAQVTLSWPASVAATGYNVKRSTTSGAEVTIATTATPGYTDLTAANGTTYFYVVSATNSVGEGANSSEASATPIAYVPVYEPFNYAAGNLANNTPGTGAGESGNWVIPTGVPTIIGSSLTYAGLPTANRAYQHTATGNQNYINLGTSSQLASGTRYISYLMKGSGNSGGDTVGVYFKGNNSTSLFAGFRAPNSAVLTGFSLGSVNSATLGGATGLGTTINISNNVVHLIVIKIDFNTSGVNDTVSLWIDPPAGTNDPGAAANSTVTTFDVGTISALGFNITGGYAAQFDEFRTGKTYGDVVGSPSPTVPTTLALSVAAGKQISWSAVSGNYYQPQSSTDNATWTDLGGQLVGTAVTSVYDPAPVAYYQVLQDTPVASEAVQNGGFETDDGGTGAMSWTGVQTQPPTRITTDFHTGTASMDLAVTNATAGANGSEIQQNVVNVGGSIIAGNTYVLSFWAKQISSGVSYVQNYKITWMDGVTPISSVGFTPFTGGSGTWVQISTGSIVAPTNATSALIQIYGATGAVLGGYGEVLVDDVSLSTTSPSGSPTVISSTVLSGAVFAATVKTNGVTAVAATGTVAFRTNNVAQSTGTVSAGSANSTPTAVPASYTITAIYSGDNIYMSSTNTLVVSGGGPSGPAVLTNSVSGGVLSLSWPPGQGWRLQMQTNSLATGLGTNWIYVTDGTLSSTNIPVDSTKPSVFYRLTYP